MWFATSRRELLAERIHYTVLANLVPNNHFNAVKYLYDRLNIIDSKAQGLLTRNGLLLTTVSIISATQIRAGTVFLHDLFWQAMFAIAYVLLVASTLATLRIMLLRFDSITVLPASAEALLQASCTCQAPRPAGCPDQPACAYRRALRTIADLKAADRHVRLSSIRSDHTIEAYEDLFFSITAERQTSLRLAQRFTIVATVLFFVVIGDIFFRAALAGTP